MNSLSPGSFPICCFSDFLRSIQISFTSIQPRSSCTICSSKQSRISQSDRHTMNHEINPEDFPLGNCLPNHEGKTRLRDLIQRFADDYHEADRCDKRVLPDGRCIPCKQEIVTVIINQLTEQGGHFKERDSSSGQWVIRQKYFIILSVIGLRYIN